MKEQKNLKPYSKTPGMRDYARRIKDAMAAEGKEVTVFIIYRAVEGISQNVYAIEIRQRFVDMLSDAIRRHKSVENKISRL